MFDLGRVIDRWYPMKKKVTMSILGTCDSNGIDCSWSHGKSLLGNRLRIIFNIDMIVSTLT